MAFELKDWIDFVKEYASSYADWYLRSLARPSNLNTGEYPWANTPEDFRAKIPVFLVLSILIGASVGSLIPGRPPIGNRATIAVTVIVLWIFVSLVIHVFCRMFGGKGSVRETLLAMLQVLAIAYVASNFLALLIVSAKASFSPVRSFLDMLNVTTPGDIILGIQFVILVVYVPLALRTVHGFFRILGALLGLVAAAVAITMGFLVYAQGGC